MLESQPRIESHVTMPSTGKHPAAPVVASTPEALAASFEAVPAPIVVAWLAGGALSLNQAARQLLVSTGPSTLEGHHRALRPRSANGEPVPLASFPLSRALAGDRVEGERIVVQRPGGHGSNDNGADDHGRGAHDLAWIVDATPVVGANGATIGAVCVYRDVTDRVLDEEMGDELLGTAAHDLRTPLTALKACVQLIERGLERLDAAARARTLTLLVAQVDKLSAKVDDVLDASRIRRGRLDIAPIDLDVGSELTKIIDELSRAPGAPNVDVKIAGGLRAHCDPARLRQVVRGLLLDAGERATDDSAVPVRASALADGSVEVVIGAGVARNTPRSRTVRRLARTVVEKLGGETNDFADGEIRFRLPAPRSAG